MSNLLPDSIAIVYSKVLSSVGIASPCSFKLSIYNSMASFAISIASSIQYLRH
jgi:hypothetical protein